MEKITPENRQKIIQMRLDGATWKEVVEKTGLRPNANTGIYKAKWFLEGKRAAKAKRKGEPKKKVVQTPVKEVKKEEIKVPVKEVKKEAVKTVEKEVEKHIKSSDKAPAKIKKKEVAESEKTKEPAEKKNSFGLWAILIIALIIGVVVIFFLLKGKKSKIEAPEEEKPKSHGFEGRCLEEL
ncbi:MAG: hypothetical protein GH144_00095 [Clostridia bacterium]|jgi:thiol:disulfide interchange protein|nr:hypothetical protein [Clostridia bacterium]